MTAQDFVCLSPEESTSRIDWSNGETSWDANKRLERLSVLPVSSPAGALKVGIQKCFTRVAHDRTELQATAMSAETGSCSLSVIMKDEEINSRYGAQKVASTTAGADNLLNASDLEDSDLFPDSTSDSDDEYWTSSEIKALPLTERYRRWQIQKYNMQDG